MPWAAENSRISLWFWACSSVGAGMAWSRMNTMWSGFQTLGTPIFLKVLAMGAALSWLMQKWGSTVTTSPAFTA